MAPALTFTLIEADLDYPGFSVAASADGFAGETEVWSPKAHVQTLLNNLAHFDASLRGEVRWEADAADEANVVLIVRPFGQAGRLEVTVDIMASRAVEASHRVHLSFVLTEPNVLTRFRSELTALLNGTSVEPAVLTPTYREAGV